jgi:hypothetical protein
MFMNTKVAFGSAAGLRCRGCQAGRRDHADQASVPARLWLVFALVAGGMMLASAASAQDSSVQDDPPPRRMRAAVQDYPDNELPRRAVAQSTPAAPTVVPDSVESPSNQSASRKKASPAGDATSDQAAQPVHGAAPSSRRAAAGDDRSTAETEEVFGSPDEEEMGFGGSLPNMRGVLGGHLWFQGDALLWWARGGGTPPLLTTSPGSTPQAQAGVLGQPNTSVIFGDQQLNTGLHAGAKMGFGIWLDNAEDSGIECSYLILGTNTQNYSNSSSGNPILARPFFNTSTGAEDSNLIAYPNLFSGTFNMTSTENFQGAEVAWRQAIVHTGEGRVDMLVGYRNMVLTDGLEIADSVTSSGTSGAAPAGTTENVSDSFHTHNSFNGGELGFSTQWKRSRWSLDTTLKMGIGETHTLVLVDGYTTVISNGTTAEYKGGLLALPSNIGPHDSNQFSVLPEVGFTLGYDLTPRLKATLGYTLLYWSNVARPGDQIDPNLDSAQFPPPTAAGVRPEFVLHTSDFWAQGINVGLDWRF